MVPEEMISPTFHVAKMCGSMRLQLAFVRFILVISLVHLAHATMQEQGRGQEKDHRPLFLWPVMGKYFLGHHAD